MLWYFTLVSFFNLPVIQYQNFRFWNFSRQICYLISPGNYVYSITLSVSLNSISQKSCCNCKLFLKTSVDFVSRIQAGRVTSTSQFHFLKPLFFRDLTFDLLRWSAPSAFASRTLRWSPQIRRMRGVFSSWKTVIYFYV